MQQAFEGIPLAEKEGKSVPSVRWGQSCFLVPFGMDRLTQIFPVSVERLAFRAHLGMHDLEKPLVLVDVEDAKQPKDF